MALTVSSTGTSHELTMKHVDFNVTVTVISSDLIINTQM